jgi:hypothetical protein
MDPELDAMSTVLRALEPLPDDAQQRVLRWVSDKLGVSQEPRQAAGPNQPVSTAEADPTTIDGSVTHARAALWMKQNDISEEALSEVFYRTGDEVQLIAMVPGRSTRERVQNVYVLAGLSQLLVSGEATYTDAFARELCRRAGCLDSTNHSRYLSDRGNEFTGSRDRGWVLTGPGLKRAAALVKEITTSSAER